MRTEENVTDVEFALFLASHFKNPCGCESEGEYFTIKPFYQREIERQLDLIQTPAARKILEEVLAE